MTNHIEHVEFLDEKAVKLSSSYLEAILIPSWGSNLISLQWKKENVNVLNVPKSSEEYLSAPFFYGIPILFPPNRIDRGKMSYAGQDYQLEVNETDKENHLHGFLHDKPFSLKSAELEDGKAVVKTELQSSHFPDIIRVFPHSFKITMIYTLDGSSLRVGAEMKNLGDQPMPFGFGYHTAFPFPLNNKGDKEACTFTLPVSKQWQLNERSLPTGELKSSEHNYKEETSPIGRELDDIFLADIDQQGNSIAALTDHAANLKVEYQCDHSFKHWVAFNGAEGLLCLEPYTWVTNAPNVNQPASLTGLEGLDPDQTITCMSTFTISSL
ncbi:aldose 1-epimerase [Bacillus gobiensis]|uniref:aldose 1-epimerase n=1 Tax=Bacillus gobiensis TaxID=1441095 RepID=UPI003D20538E